MKLYHSISFFRLRKELFKVRSIGVQSSYSVQSSPRQSNCFFFYKKKILNIVHFYVFKHHQHSAKNQRCSFERWAVWIVAIRMRFVGRAIERTVGQSNWKLAVTLYLMRCQTGSAQQCHCYWCVENASVQCARTGAAGQRQSSSAPVVFVGTALVLATAKHTTRFVAFQRFVWHPSSALHSFIYHLLHAVVHCSWLLQERSVVRSAMEAALEAAAEAEADMAVESAFTEVTMSSKGAVSHWLVENAYLLKLCVGFKITYFITCVESATVAQCIAKSRPTQNNSKSIEFVVFFGFFWMFFLTICCLTIGSIKIAIFWKSKNQHFERRKTSKTQKKN